MPDIKEWLCRAAGTLASGHVVMPPSLSMQEAMMALELMDPAMDWGMNFAPHGKFDPGANLSPEQLCWVMDEMAAREVAWHRGATLAQTVFSSLHYHNATFITPNVPQDHEDYMSAYAACAALRAFVLAYAKGVEVAHVQLLDNGNGAVRDGEDLWLDNSGIPLNADEGVDDVAVYVENTISWLRREGFSDGWWVEVINRLVFRRTWLDMLQLRPVYQVPNCRLSEAKVPGAFDNVLPFLRQNMPLPTLPFPSHEETWDVLKDAVHQVRYVYELDALPLHLLEQELLGIPKMLPIVRTLFKIGVVESRSRDELVDTWLSRATGQEPNVLARIDEEITQPLDRRSFALWRDIISGNLPLNLSTSLYNSSRRRRAYQHLARAWSDQAQAAARLQQRYPSFSPLVSALQARALDCELEAALLAFSLRLVAAGEHRAQWWWVLSITLHRISLPVRGWEASWAQMWAAVASAMVLLYTIAPRGTEEPTLPRFLLRHKIPTNGAHPARPLHSKWEASRAALDEAGRDRSNALSTAREWLKDASAQLSNLARTTRLDTGHLADDVAHNLDVLSTDLATLSWDVDGPLSQRRVPRLKSQTPSQ